MTTTADQRVPLLPLLTVNFIGALGYSVILPFLVFLVQDFKGNAVVYGVLSAMYPAFQFLGAPILGRWSDRLGRKKVLLISQIGTFVSWLIFIGSFYLPLDTVFGIDTQSYGTILFTVPLLVLFLARSLDGLTGGNVSVANAYLADISKPENRKANFGKMSASMNVGFILGPVLAGFLASVDNGKFYTVLLTAGISLVGIGIIYFLLPNTPDLSESDPEPSADQKPSFSVLFANRSIRLLLLLYFLIFLGFNFFYATFPVYTSSILAWSPSKLGWFFSLLSGVMIFVQGPGLAWLGQRFTEKQLFVAGNVILTFTFCAFTIPSETVLYAAAVGFGLGNGIMWPSYMSILSGTGSKKQQGALQGYATSMGSIASIIGLIAGGFLFKSLASSVYFLTAAMLLVAGGMGFWLQNTSSDK